MKLNDMLSKGHFPKELPPPFTTKFFAAYYAKHSATLPNVKEASRGISFSVPRLGIVRKTLVVTNPAHQTELSKYIVRHWNDIQTQFAKSKLSCSKPIYDGERAANPMSFKEFKRHCFKSSFFHRYEIKTDVSKYYPSIYTHSIAWATHGKDYSKAHRKAKFLGNDLDYLIRRTQSDQTIGIPIGPDSSLIIQEIIGSEIDKRLTTKIKSIVGHRYVDDMHFYFSDVAQAEICLKELSHILREFELQINAEKTKIKKLPLGIEDDWLIRLRKFVVSNKRSKQENDLISFFSLAFEYAQKFHNEFVMTYAIRRIEKIRVEKDCFKTYEALLYKTILAESSTMRDVLSILLSYKSWVDKRKLKKVIEEIIHHRTPRGFDYEVSWALWYAKTFQIKLTQESAKALATLIDPITMLVALDCANSKLLRKKDLDAKNWITSINQDWLFDEKWLLAYEISVKKWIKSKFAYLDTSTPKNQYFKKLKDNKISFYDHKQQVEIYGDFTKQPKKKEIAVKKPIKQKETSGGYDYQ